MESRQRVPWTASAAQPCIKQIGAGCCVSYSTVRQVTVGKVELFELVAECAVPGCCCWQREGQRAVMTTMGREDRPARFRVDPKEVVLSISVP